jgi:polysaccharide pyruvyl transferase WcaK-like protein
MEHEKYIYGHKEVKIKYIGWLGCKNLGDEICFEVFSKLVKNAASVRKDLIVEVDYSPHAMIGDEDALVIGGGTLLRLASDNRTSVMKFALSRKIPLYFFGTGVIDVPYETVDKINPEVLDILNKSELVCVRGPQSKKNLADNGFFGAKVISDPGLLINDGSLCDNIDSKEIGINIGSTCHNLFGSERYVFSAVDKAIDKLIKMGYSITLFPMWDKDFDILKEFHKDRAIKVLPWNANIYNLLDYLRNFKFVIGMKLHSIITAASLGIPYISLAYRNKCIDFSETVGAAKYCIKTDEPNLCEKIMEKVKELENGYEQFQANLSHYTALYKPHYKNLVERIVTGRAN